MSSNANGFRIILGGIEKDGVKSTAAIAYARQFLQHLNFDDMTNSFPDVMSSGKAEAGSLRSTLNSVVSAYLSERIPEYRELTALRKEGWQDSAADGHFEQERMRADHATEKAKDAFYKMTCNVGHELHKATGALSLSLSHDSDLRVLDLCMAPGGFTTAALTYTQTTCVRGVSLPVEMGGHQIRVPRWESDPRIAVKLLDITMLATEMGVDIQSEIPASHPDASRFLPDRLFEGEEFGLIFCGGTVLRTHRRAEYRQSSEATRLQTSQLVLALGRVCRGGTLIVVMHRADAWDSVDLIHLFSGFADIQLFKPSKAHARRSSFYMVARNVQPQKPEVAQAIERWKKQWRAATFGGTKVADSEEFHDESCNAAQATLEVFGERLVSMTKPVFKIQADALRRAPWTKNKK